MQRLKGELPKEEQDRLNEFYPVGQLRIAGGATPEQMKSLEHFLNSVGRSAQQTDISKAARWDKLMAAFEALKKEWLEL